MLFKSLMFGAVLCSTPLCLLNVQEPAAAARPAAAAQDPEARAELARAQDQLELVRCELAEAQRDLGDMRRQIGELLDAMDARFLALRSSDRSYSCNPTRRRELMSHYQWLDRNRHEQRAATALAQIVAEAGGDVERLDQQARELMTGKDSAGRFDRIALAFAERMEQLGGQRLRPNQLDTMALARFLDGQVEQAVALQQQAVARGGNDDEYRRKLRTYQVAQQAIAAARAATGAAERLVAVNEDDE
jgi:hypothetical protein